MSTSGTIRTGIGGWTFEPWEGTFYPEKLPKKRRLEHASRQLTAIEVNGTYYSSQKPETFAKWAADVPEDFVFSLKASRFVTNRKVLAEAGESMTKFLTQGLTELGHHLGPILWQFAPTKNSTPRISARFWHCCPKNRTASAFATWSKCETRHFRCRNSSIFSPNTKSRSSAPTITIIRCCLT